MSLWRTGEKDTIRRVKNELLRQLDGSIGGADQVAFRRCYPLADPARPQSKVRCTGCARLCQYSGWAPLCLPPAQNKGVIFVGTTNVPWEIDPALRRRFEKLIHVPLPDHATRLELLRLGVDGEATTLSSADIARLARRTDGFSGSDCNQLVRRRLAGSAPSRRPSSQSQPPLSAPVRPCGRACAWPSDRCARR